ncbi:hypothetical protein BDZ91DRAFT_209603 [Kalaharituber pfeilii]|nr:hypothetical protein BDZ91DRAFT_209603 [Kalaharituber pfeilii]
MTKIECIKLSLSSIFKAGEDDTKDAGDDATLLDIKFVDNEALILLVTSEVSQTTHLVTAPYSTLPFSSSPPYLSSIRRDSSVTAKEDLASAFSYTVSNIQSRDIEPIKVRVFEWSNGFLPERVVVNGKPERRIGAVIDGEGLKYVVFDLDEDETVAEAAEEGEMEEEAGEGGGAEDEDEVEAEVEEGAESDGDEPMDEGYMDMSS